MFKYLVLLCALLIYSSAHAQENKSFAQGYNYYQQGDFDKAIVYFDAAIKENPKHGDAWYFKGLLLARKGKAKEALPLFNKAIEINPADPAYHGDRGIVYSLLGNDTEALNDFKLAAKYDSLNATRQFNLALYYINHKQREAAVTYLNKCLKVNPDHLKARFERATCLVLLSRRKEAIADYTYVIEHFENQSTALNPTDYNELLGHTYYMRGAIYGEAKEYVPCIADLKKAITYKKDDASLYNDLGYYLAYTNEANSALPYLDKSIELEPSLNNYNSRAYAHFKLGEFDLAEKDALKARSIDDTYAESYYNLALIYNGMGKLTESCTSKKTAVKLGSAKAKALQIKGCN